MRAELTINHKPGQLVQSLRSAFGEHNRGALEASALALKSPSSANSISFAAYGPGLLVMAWPTPGRLVLFIESSGGRLRKAAEDVWKLVHGNDQGLNPKLASLVLFDEDANDDIAQARIGLGENVKRTEIAGPIVVAVLTAVLLTVAIAGFNASWDLAVGSIPAFAAAILALGLLVIDTRRKRLVWE